MKRYFESKCPKLRDKNKNILTVQFYLVLFKNYLRIYNIFKDIYLRLLRYYLKATSILFQILIDYKRFLFISIVRRFKTNNFLDFLCYLDCYSDSTKNLIEIII